jgi:outer membrane protein assembly factor BamA
MHSGGRGAKLQNKLPGEFFRSAVYIFLVAWLFSSSPALGQKNFEKRHVSAVEITISGTPTESAEAEQLRAVAADTIGSEYSVVKVRESIEALHDTGRVVSVVVSAKEDGPQSVVVQYL